MNYAKHMLSSLHPLRFLAFALGFFLFIFLTFNAATQAEDPKYTEGQPRGLAAFISNPFAVFESDNVPQHNNVASMQNEATIEKKQSDKHSSSNSSERANSINSNRASVEKAQVPSQNASSKAEAAKDVSSANRSVPAAVIHR